LPKGKTAILSSFNVSLIPSALLYPHKIKFTCHYTLATAFSDPDQQRPLTFRCPNVMSFSITWAFQKDLHRIKAPCNIS
jgi:hypothetical protein